VGSGKVMRPRPDIFAVATRLRPKHLSMPVRHRSESRAAPRPLRRREGRQVFITAAALPL